MILSVLFLFLFYVKDYYYDFIRLDGVTEKRGGEREGRGVMEEWGGRRVTAGSGSRGVGGRLKECWWQRGRKKRRERKEKGDEIQLSVMVTFFCINSSSGSSFSLYLLFHLLSSFFCFSALSVLFCTVSSDYLAFKNSFFKSFVFSSVFASSICFFFSFSSFRTLILYLTVRFLAFPDFLYPYQIPLCVGLSFPPSVLYFPFLGLCFLPAVFSWFLSFVSSVFHYLPSELSLLLRFLFLGHHFQHLSVLFCCICLSRPRQFEAFHWDWHRDFSSQASGLLSLCLSWSFNYSGCSPPARSRWTFSKHLNRPDPPASPFFPPFLSWAVQSAWHGYLSKMLQPCWVCQLSLYINASWGILLTLLPPDPWGDGGLLALCVWPPFNGNIQPKAFQRFFKLINVLASNTDDYKHLVLNIIYSVFLSVLTSTCCQVLIFSNVRTIRIFKI